MIRILFLSSCWLIKKEETPAGAISYWSLLMLVPSKRRKTLTTRDKHLEAINPYVSVNSCQGLVIKPMVITKKWKKIGPLARNCRWTLLTQLTDEQTSRVKHRQIQEMLDHERLVNRISYPPLTFLFQPLTISSRGSTINGLSCSGIRIDFLTAICLTRVYSSRRQQKKKIGNRRRAARVKYQVRKWMPCPMLFPFIEAFPKRRNQKTVRFYERERTMGHL